MSEDTSSGTADDVMQVIETLGTVYDFEGVTLAYHMKRDRWGGLSAHGMIKAGRVQQVIEWADGLAGGPLAVPVRVEPTTDGNNHE